MTLKCMQRRFISSLPKLWNVQIFNENMIIKVSSWRKRGFIFAVMGNENTGGGGGGQGGTDGGGGGGGGTGAGSSGSGGAGGSGGTSKARVESVDEIIYIDAAENCGYRSSDRYR